MATYRLKRKTFSDVKQKIFFQAADGSSFTLDEVRKSMGLMEGEKVSASDVKAYKQSKASVNKVTNDARQAQRSANKTLVETAKNNGQVNPFKTVADKAKNSGFKAGQNSVGIKQGAVNTWKNMGKMGRIGTVVGGAALAGLAAKGLMGNKKD